jgi:hypothetical protein
MTCSPITQYVQNVRASVLLQVVLEAAESGCALLQLTMVHICCMRSWQQQRGSCVGQQVVLEAAESGCAVCVTS